ncbi:BglG family transcription antiterminator LicT [Clostridium neuense]|uniref:BglG family transcription antiterminator LicT n=1 Tax=Clostridium neuense TaxID=1728934 RepID=A0ABW8TJV1_9CLOT
MIILKILNNNLVLSKDKDGREIIVKGCGIAFQKKRGESIDESIIEKVFVPENKQNSEQMQKFLASISEEYFDFVQKYVDKVKKEINIKLSDSIYLSLSDHLSGAIERFKKGIVLHNFLLLDIKQLYKTEYDIGLNMVEELNKKFDTKLLTDEAGFIALHFVNAQDQNVSADSYQMTVLINEIINIIKQYYGDIKFEEDNIYYQRFLTHLKYFAKRFLNKEQNYDQNMELFNIVKEQYANAYGCVKLIYLMMQEKYQYELTVEEMLYLIIHIQKITENK